MKDRIRRIMEDHNMSQKDFALKCGISDATLSQVFSGKVGATQKTVQKVLSAFPSISLAWLMYGQGPMYMETPADYTPTPTEQPGSGDFFQLDTGAGATDEIRQPASLSYSPTTGAEGRRMPTEGAPTPSRQPEIVRFVEKPERRIKEIRIFFDDGTYEIFVPQSK